MSFSQFARSTAAAGCALLVHAVAHGQINFTPEAGEYLIAGSRDQAQVYADVAISPQGGYLVWQDTITDGAGEGISALKLAGNLSATLSSFRVNELGEGDQKFPKVALLADGGAVFVWQGGEGGFPHVYARFLSADGTWLTGDVAVDPSPDQVQEKPCVTTLKNGNIVVLWSGYSRSGGEAMRDVHGQLFSPDGQKVGSQFTVNAFTPFNQRTPSVASLTTGGFAVTWVSEQERFENSVDVYARVFTSSASASGLPFILNTSSNVCANPSLAGAADGGFLAAWSENDFQLSNRWDVVSRPVSVTQTAGEERQINTYTYGDQVGPHVAMIGGDYLTFGRASARMDRGLVCMANSCVQTAHPWVRSFR